jgi:glutaredoxin
MSATANNFDNSNANIDANNAPRDGNSNGPAFSNQQAEFKHELPPIAEVVRNAIHLNSPLVLFTRDDSKSEEVNDWLGKRKIPHTVIDCATDPRGEEMLRELARITDGSMSTPKVFLRGHYLGSAENVLKLATDGELEEIYKDRAAFYDANRGAVVHPLPSGPRNSISSNDLLAKKAEIAFKASAKRLSDNSLPFTERVAAAADAVVAKASGLWQSFGTTAPAEKTAPPAQARRSAVSSQ